MKDKIGDEKQQKVFEDAVKNQLNLEGLTPAAPPAFFDGDDPFAMPAGKPPSPEEVAKKMAEEAKKQKRLTEKDRKLRMETKTAKADTTVSKPGFKPPFKHRPTNTNADKPCFNCNMKGHWARDCPLPHRKEK